MTRKSRNPRLRIGYGSQGTERGVGMRSQCIIPTPWRWIAGAAVTTSTVIDTCYFGGDT